MISPEQLVRFDDLETPPKMNFEAPASAISSLASLDSERECGVADVTVRKRWVVVVGKYP